MTSDDHATTNSTHTTPSQTSKQQYTYSFHRQPLNSAVGRSLISELDAELSQMYADIMPVDGYRGSPTPTPAPVLPIEGPIEPLDSVGNVQASQSTAQHDPAAPTQVLSSLKEAAERNDVVFVVAYATPVTNTASSSSLDSTPPSHTDNANGTTSPSPSPSTNTSSASRNPPPPNSTPAGCYAILFHPHPPDSPGLPFPPDLHVAELRRCYIRPQFRGRSALIPSPSPLTSTNPLSTPEVNSTKPTPNTSTTLSSLLLAHLHNYASTTLNLDRLILVTGYRQLAAIRVYERAGWVDRGEIGLWGNFIEEVRSRNMEGRGMLRCMEKRLRE